MEGKQYSTGKVALNRLLAQTPHSAKPCAGTVPTKGRVFRNPASDLLQMSHITVISSQNRHGRYCPQGRAGRLMQEKSQRSSQMAGTQTQPAQGGAVSKPEPSKGQPAGAASQSDAQPVFRDWAAI